jgi:hypothetical protein
MKTTIISVLATLALMAGAYGATAPNGKAYPDHWGNPPQIQTRDIRPLPGGYGQGSSTLAKWIQKNLEKDATGGKTADAAPQAGWTPLLAGNSLDGWSVKSGFATYTIKDGVVTGTTAKGSPNSFLCSDKQYGDFELEFDVKCSDHLNSGVQIRSKLRKPEGKYGGRVNGPQVEIEASGKSGAESGYIYGEATGRGWLTPKDQLKPRKVFKDGEWNHYRVVAKGPRIQTWINGKPVADLTDEAIYKTHPKGLIGLQVHGIGKNAGPYTVQWRKLRIKEL